MSIALTCIASLLKQLSLYTCAGRCACDSDHVKRSPDFRDVAARCGVQLKGFATIPVFVSDDEELARTRFAQMHLQNRPLGRFCWCPKGSQRIAFVDLHVEGDEIVFSAVGSYAVVDEAEFSEAFGPEAVAHVDRLRDELRHLCGGLSRPDDSRAFRCGRRSEPVCFVERRFRSST